MNIIGIHLDSPFIRVSFITKRRQKIEIRALTEHLADEISNVKPLYIKEFNGKTASGISTKDSLIRSMELKIRRHIEQAIAFQSEATNHFKPEDVLTVPILKKKEDGITEALLFTVSRDAMKNHLAELKKYQIDPDSVSTVSLALSHFIGWKFPKLQNAFVIDLGSSETTCALLLNGELKKAHAISMGIEKLLEALYEDRKKILLQKEVEPTAAQLDLLLLKSNLHPELSAQLAKMRQEIGKVFYSFCREERVDVIFTGRTDAFKHLSQSLIEYDENKWPLTIEERKFAISTGLALEQTTARPLQLRREEFFPQKNWIRLGKGALSLFAASILLSASLVCLGLRASHIRKVEMAHSLGIATQGDIDERIDQWIIAIDKGNKEYPYILQTPKVAELLAWISSHPLLNELKNEQDPIQIHELRYQLISFPRIDHSKDPYVTKVEMEFNFNSPTNARRFHEALRKGEDFIDTQSEITWDASSHRYRTSFFLKNRGPHVS